VNPLRIEVGRLQVALEGVDETMAEQAMQGLTEELRSRLARIRLVSVPDVPVDVERVAMTVSAERLDAVTLRTIIAERLAEQIELAGLEEERH
jgi:hypothetical protein